MDLAHLFHSVTSMLSPRDDAPDAPYAAADAPRALGLPAWLVSGEAARLASTSFAHQEDIDRALAGKTADQIRELKAAYEAQTGLSFEARFGSDLDRWDPRLGAEAAATATTLNAMTFDTQAQVDETFAGKTREEILAIRRAWDAQHPEYPWDQRFGSDYSRWAPDRPDPDVDPAKVDDAVDKMLAAEGLATYDAQAILDAMRGKSPAELEEMRRVFRARMDGASMDAWVDAAMQGMTGLGSGGDLGEAQAILSGDPIAGAVAGLENAAFGGYTSWGTDKAKLMKVLDGLDEGQRKGVIERYDAAHPDQPLGVMLAGELSGNDSEKAAALMDGDKATARAIDMDAALHGGWLGHAMDAVGVGGGTDEQGAEDVFASLTTDAERQKFLRDYYTRRNGAAPADDAAALAYFEGEAASEASGAQKDVLVGLAGGDKVAVAAGRMELSRDGFWGPDLDAMAGQMDLGIDREQWRKMLPEERDAALAEHRAFQAQLEAKWGSQYGGGGDDAFGKMIDLTTASALDVIPGHENLDAERMQQMREDGRMSDAFAARYFMSGVGTNDEGLQDIVTGMNETEMATFLEEFKAETGEDFETWIADDTSGRLYHDLHTATLYGDAPEKLENKLGKEEADYDFELGSGEGVLGGVVEGLSTKDDRLKRQHARIAELSAEMGDHPSPEQLAELEKLLGWQNSDRKQWRSDVDSVSDGAATCAELAALAAVTIATGGGTSAGFLALLGTESAATGATVAAMGGAALAGLSKMAVKRGVSGAAYGTEAFGTDLAMTTGEVLTAGLMKTSFMKDGLGAASEFVTDNELLQKVVSGALGGAAGGVLQEGIVGNLVNPENWKGGNDAGDILWSILGSAAGGAKGGAIGAGLSPLGGQFGKDNPLLWGALRGGLDSVAGAALSADTYEGDALQKLLGAGLRGTVRGTIDAYGDGKVAEAEEREQRADLRKSLEGAAAMMPVDDVPVHSSPTTEDPAILLGLQMAPRGAQVTLGEDGQVVQVAANPEAVQARAQTQLAGMDPDTQEWMRGMIDHADNDAQRAMIERAIAAGRPPGDVIRLAGDMVGKEGADIMQYYTGAGMWQKYHQSCAPTAYQISLAQVDPVAAMEYREGQVYAAMQQEDALAAQKVRPSPRLFNTPAIDQELAGDLDLYDHLAATADPRSKATGIDPSQLKGTQLHGELEAATGDTYEFKGREGGQKYKDSDGTFAPEAVPFDDVRSALDENKPVMFGADGHRRTIVGYGNHPETGEPVYIAIDPYTGGYLTIPESQLAGTMLPSSMTLPRRGASGPAPALGTDEPAGSEGSLGSLGSELSYEDLRRRFGAHEPDDLPALLGLAAPNPLLADEPYQSEHMPATIGPTPRGPEGDFPEHPAALLPDAGAVIDPVKSPRRALPDLGVSSPEIAAALQRLQAGKPSGLSDAEYKKQLKIDRETVAMAAYDPGCRSQMDLLSDLRPEHNPDGRYAIPRGKSPAFGDATLQDTSDAQEYRSLMALAELERRAALRRDSMDTFYPQAPDLDIRANDAVFEDKGAHTVDRHLADMTGPGSIKSRLEGDPEWQGTAATSTSCRWQDEATANAAINGYVKGNWDEVRNQLIDSGYYDALVDAEEDIGKGFTNGKGHQKEKVREVSTFRLRLRMVDGHPPRIFVLTAFPEPQRP